jgi:hypothetical protein
LDHGDGVCHHNTNSLDQVRTTKVKSTRTG